MPWVHFTHDFNWSPPERNGRVVLMYRKGLTLFVRRVCADEVLRKHKGQLVARPENPVKQHAGRRA